MAKTEGLTQAMVAEAGGLPGQNAISRLVSNHKMGPSVETFTRAVQGLGIRVSQFFAELEYIDDLAAAKDALEHGRIEVGVDLKKSDKTVFVAVNTKDQSPPRRARGYRQRLDDLEQALGTQDDRAISNAQRIAHLADLTAQLDRRFADLAASVAAHRNTDPAAPRHRPTPRKRVRRSA
jgi:transcriptional regulator with XRE-family HTH domain